MAVGRIRNKSRNRKNPEMRGTGRATICGGQPHPEKVGKSETFEMRGIGSKGNNFVAVGRVRNKSEKSENPENYGNERNMLKGTILWRSDASGKRRKIRKKTENPGNERNRKGNNFVTAGPIRIRSEKSGNDTNVKRNNCETSVWKTSGRSGKSGNGKDTKGIC